MKKLIEIVNNFKGKRIGVIGDLMIDYFIWGNSERISPEAPVPIVFVTKESFRPGGAANTANNIAALGGNVSIIGLVNNDIPGRQLAKLLEKKGIDTTGLFEDRNRPTVQKIRVIVRGQQIVRIDKEKKDYINKRQEKQTIDFIASQIKDYDGLVISDYAKGFITKNLMQEIINLSKKYKKFIISDTKPKHACYFKDITLLSPNYKEAIQIAKTEDLQKAGKIIQEQLNCNVLITQGSQGMTLFENNEVRYFPTKAKEVFDVVGAGDTVIAALSLALASGANLGQSVVIANYAAGIAVSKIGTAVVFSEELKKKLKNDE